MPQCSIGAVLDVLFFLINLTSPLYMARSCHKSNVDYRSHNACFKQTYLGDLACGIHNTIFQELINKIFMFVYQKRLRYIVLSKNMNALHFNKVIIIPAKVANKVKTATTITIRLFCTEARELR